MDAIVELTSLGATRYGGNYTVFQQQKDTEFQAATRDLAHAEKTRAEAARRAQQAAERKARKDSAGRKARSKGDQPKILMDAARIGPKPRVARVPICAKPGAMRPKKHSPSRARK